MFSLPFEIRNLVFGNLNLKDVMAVYHAYTKRPSAKQLNLLFCTRDLPSPFSLNSLALFEELTMEDKLKYCIQVNDVDSFKRLYTQGQLTFKYKRPEIIIHYLTQKLKCNTLTGQDIALMVCERLYSLASLIIVKTC